MKKNILYSLFLLIISFCFITNVNAVTVSSFEWTDAFDSSYYNLQNQYVYYNNHLTQINNFKQYYNDNWSSTFPYYVIYGGLSSGIEFVCLSASYDNSIKGIYYNSSFSYILNYNSQYCWNDHNGYNSPSISNGVEQLFSASLILESNSSYYYSSDSYGMNSSVLQLIYPSYTSTDFNVTSFSITDNNPIPTVISLYDGSYNNNEIIGYTDINLNNYDYVILSLKDYSITESFSTIFYVKGQLCLTPVYDYGMVEKSKYYPGYEVQPCSAISYDFVPINVSILEQDLKYKSVYYIKAFDTHIDNIIKVNLSLFDVSYVTSENINNPTVLINGRSYPVIPYDNLSSSSTISEENGYIPGATCRVDDINCIYENEGLDISNLFTHPLQLLETLWSSIVSVFSIITVFITILPPQLQTFLYVAFMISIIFGILSKIV